MNRVVTLMILSALITAGCCTTHSGYGRYTMAVCDKVEIASQTYELTKSGDEFVIDGHTVARGIYRKTEPWLYVHEIGADKVDVTFDSGDKNSYPLYVGSSASIFDVYAHPWEMKRSTCAEFAGQQWLVSHRWTSDGIYFDLQKQVGNATQWQLMQADIFVPSDGTQVDIPAIQTGVKILDFQSSPPLAQVQFVAL